MSELSKGEKLLSNFKCRNEFSERAKQIFVNAINEIEKLHLEYDESDKTDTQYEVLDELLEDMEAYLEDATECCIEGFDNE